MDCWKIIVMSTELVTMVDSGFHGKPITGVGFSNNSLVYKEIVFLGHCLPELQTFSYVHSIWNVFHKMK